MYCISHIQHHDPMGQQLAEHMHSQEEHIHTYADLHSMQLQQQSEVISTSHDSTIYILVVLRSLKVLVSKGPYCRTNEAVS